MSSLLMTQYTDKLTDEKETLDDEKRWIIFCVSTFLRSAVLLIENSNLREIHMV